MYRPTPSLRDRAGPLAAVVLIHVGIGYGLLHLTGVDVELARQADLAIFDISAAPPPPPPPPPVERNAPKQEKPKRDEGAASPRNIASRATPVVAPKPRVIVPTPSPIVAATTPATSTAPTQGASPVVGPGTGAGGTGTGTGSGGSGAGAGGGGGGGGNGLGEARARLVTPLLSRRDFPPALYRQAPRGGTVFMVLRVGPDGVPVSCRVTRSFGDMEIDAETCRLAVARLRFSPGRDDQGRPVADYFGYRQEFNTRY